MIYHPHAHGAALFDCSKYPDSHYSPTYSGILSTEYGVDLEYQGLSMQVRRGLAERSPSITYHRVISPFTRLGSTAGKRSFLKDAFEGFYLFDLYKRAVRPGKVSMWINTSQFPSRGNQSILQYCPRLMNASIGTFHSIIDHV